MKPSTAPVNRRATRRKGLRCSGELVLPDGGTRAFVTVDTGVDGLSFLCARPIAPGTRCHLRFELSLGERIVSVRGDLKTVYSSFSGPEGFKIGAVYTGLSEDGSAALREFCAATP